MFFVSEIMKKAPDRFKSPPQERVVNNFLTYANHIPTEIEM